MNGNVRQTAPELTCGTLWVTSDNSPTRDGTGPQKAPEGTEDMKSIDNLRDYVLTAPSICSTTRAILVCYVDEIEREVKELTDERDLLKTQWEAGVDLDQRLEACADKREDVTLVGVDYMAYPLDADGVPIHIGDVMEVISSKQHAKACYMQMGPSGTWAVGLTQDCHWYDTESLRHHAATVEDVLREFTERLDEIGSEDDCAGVDEQECRACIRRDIAAAYAEYAARLMLAGEDE